MPGSTGYQVRVRVRGELSRKWWSAVFADMAVKPEPDGTTLVSGEVPDQAALHGLLATIRDLGLALISVETDTSPDAASAPHCR